jgi:hypothetical protein
VNERDRGACTHPSRVTWRALPSTGIVGGNRVQSTVTNRSPTLLRPAYAASSRPCVISAAAADAMGTIHPVLYLRGGRYAEPNCKLPDQGPCCRSFLVGTALNQTRPWLSRPIPKGPDPLKFGSSVRGALHTCMYNLVLLVLPAGIWLGTGSMKCIEFRIVVEIGPRSGCWYRRNPLRRVPPPTVGHTGRRCSIVRAMNPAEFSGSPLFRFSNAQVEGLVV